jgi:5'(3')-deoxyribonucleotidase
VTPRLLLDMDGPLADFDAHFWQRCKAEGWQFDIDDPAHQRHRFFDGHIIDKAHRKLARQMIEGTPWFRDLPVTPGAVDGVPLLMERFDVWVCTKPLEANQWCASDKAAWIARHFPALVGKLIMAPDKSMITGHVLLDDAPNPDWFDAATWVPIVFEAPFNGAGSKWEGIPSWTWGGPIEILTIAAKFAAAVA